LARRTHLVPPASPTSELSSPCESVASTLGCPSAAARCSPGFFPFEAFSCHALGSLPVRVSRIQTRFLVRRLGRVARRTINPSSRVSSSPARVPKKKLVDGFQSVMNWPAPSLDGDSFPPGLGIPGEPGVLTFRASKCVVSGVSPRRPPAPLGFLASSPASWLWGTLQSWLLPRDSPGVEAPVSGHPPALRTLEHLS